MAQQLSPKQYIQTKARSLPVYKCFVNKDWHTAHMAQVLVMRSHVNGNITAGIYLVDLWCLGVKDTTYFFNLTQEEIQERFGDDFDKMFSEADYDLVHNIVYAGHDFALEYDIKPHADFAITKFILEEDDDSIPLIEIEVGDEDKPHLFVTQPGQYSEALAKLKKNAGEGNYFYSIAAEDDEEDFEEEGYGDDDDGQTVDDEEYPEEEGRATTLEEIEIGELTVQDARFISDEDIFNEHEVSERDEDEKLAINVEAGIRALRIARPELYDDEELDEVTARFLASNNYSAAITEEQENAFIQARTELIEFYEGLSEEERNIAGKEKTEQFSVLENGKNNPLVVGTIFENALYDKEGALYAKAKGYLQALAPQYVSASLSLSLAALLKNEDAELYNAIYNSENIEDAFPGITDFGSNDVNTYSLIQALVSVRDNDLRYAVYYYYLSADAEEYCNLLTPVQAELLMAIGKELGFDKGEDDIKPTLRIV